jgi:hypothetical protein
MRQLIGLLVGFGLWLRRLRLVVGVHWFGHFDAFGLGRNWEWHFGSGDRLVVVVGLRFGLHGERSAFA